VQQPQGTVEKVVPDHDTIETKGGKEVSRKGTEDDPAVELKADTGVRFLSSRPRFPFHNADLLLCPLLQNKAIKLAHELVRLPPLTFRFSRRSSCSPLYSTTERRRRVRHWLEDLPRQGGGFEG
jgi:hypothetical protein